MTTTATPLFLRRVLGLDAAASGAVGLLLTFGSGLLADLLKLDPGVARPAGLFLIGWSLGVTALALQTRPARLLVLAVIAINLVWTVESVLSLTLGWLQPNALGVAFVIAQALAVAGFAGLQIFALRPVSRAA